MTVKNTETTYHTRPISEAEKSKMRRTHWMLLPALLIPVFIIWVITLIGDLPNAVRYAAYTIAVGAVIVMFWKQSKLERDLKNGEAEVICGILEDKYKFGGGSKAGAGLYKGKNRSRGQASFILVFNGKKYWVQPKIFKAAVKGEMNEMVWLPSSQYVISIQIV